MQSILEEIAAACHTATGEMQHGCRMHHVVPVCGCVGSDFDGAYFRDSRTSVHQSSDALTWLHCLRFSDQCLSSPALTPSLARQTRGSPLRPPSARRSFSFPDRSWELRIPGRRASPGTQHSTPGRAGEGNRGGAQTLLLRRRAADAGTGKQQWGQKRRGGWTTRMERVLGTHGGAPGRAAHGVFTGRV